MITGIGAIGTKLQPSGVENTIGLSPSSLGQTAGTDIGQSFATMVSEAANRTIDTLKGAENVSVQALQGDADMRKVADAVMTAEQSLQAAVAIRDKIVTAYLEVSRMAI
jgi:flagellar hook-basal body complex protein FliE